MFALRRSFLQFDGRVRVLAVGWLINALGFSMIYPFLSIYLHSKRGFPMDRVGLVFLAMGAARMAGPLIAGVFCDRFGRKRIMAGSPGVQGCLFLVLAHMVHTEASLPAIAAMLALVNLVGAFFQAAADTYVADIVAPERRADAYALMRVGLNVGWMTGPAVGAFLAKTPFSLLFLVTAGCAFTLSAFTWTFCRETLTAPSGAGAASRLSLKVFRGHPAFLRHCLFCLCVFLVSSQLVSTLSVYTTEVVGISRQQLGMAYTLNGALVIFFQFPASRLLGRLAMKWQTTLGAVFYGAGYFLLGRAGGYPAVLGSVAVITFGEILVMPSSVAVATRHAPPDATGRFVGLYGLTRGLGYTIGPWLGGTLFAALPDNPSLLWTIIAANAAVAAVGFATARHAASTERGQALPTGGRS